MMLRPRRPAKATRVAYAFVRDMRALFKATNQLKHEIASCRLHALWALRSPGDASRNGRSIV